mmetsp:Transcript_115534/g.288709  ORF Transcript_115534/g.288709 Transcript_115534/m.288709 type:complete len:213 (+) Transcript_115534:587-1225(+)
MAAAGAAARQSSTGRPRRWSGSWKPTRKTCRGTSRAARTVCRLSCGSTWTASSTTASCSGGGSGRHTSVSRRSSTSGCSSPPTSLGYRASAPRPASGPSCWRPCAATARSSPAAAPPSRARRPRTPRRRFWALWRIRRSLRNKCSNSRRTWPARVLSKNCSTPCRQSSFTAAASTQATTTPMRGRLLPLRAALRVALRPRLCRRLAVLLGHV